MSAAASANGSGAAESERTPSVMRLGGMALRNGLLIHGPTAWAVAARAPDGSIRVASGPKPSLARGRLGSIPILRGPLRLAEAMAVLPLARLRLPSARLAFEDRTVAAVAGISVAGSHLMRRRRGPTTVARELAVAVLGTLPAVAALRDPSLAAYHAVEHKAIGGYEQGRDPAEVPKEHERCGSNLVAPMLGFSIAAQVLTERLIERPGPLVRALAALAGVGAAVEVFVHADRHPDSAVGAMVHGPGHEIQRLLSTREPSSEQLAVGIAALDELLVAEGADPATVGEAREGASA